MGSNPTSPVVLLMLSLRSFLRKIVEQNQHLGSLLFLLLDFFTKILYLKILIHILNNNYYYLKLIIYKYN